MNNLRNVLRTLNNFVLIETIYIFNKRGHTIEDLLKSASEHICIPLPLSQQLKLHLSPNRPWDTCYILEWEVTYMLHSQLQVFSEGEVEGGEGVGLGL